MAPSLILNKMRLKKKMKILLIAAELEGIGQKELTMKVRTKIWNVDHIKEILEDWKTRQLVQKFIVKKDHSKRPITIWRATELIKTERL